MTKHQLKQYNKLLRRREQLANFIYLAELPLVNNGFGGLCSIKDYVVLDTATDLAYRTIVEIDKEIENLFNDGIS